MRADSEFHVVWIRMDLQTNTVDNETNKRYLLTVVGATPWRMPLERADGVD
jgi:hypothetical protein